MEERWMSPVDREGERPHENTLRPSRFEEYVGQSQLKANLRIMVEASRGRGRLWTMFCSVVLRVLERPLWPISLQRNGGWTST